MIATRERPMFATFANALERGASATAGALGGTAVVVVLTTRGSGGSTMSPILRGGRGAAAGGSTATGTKEIREPDSAGRMLYSGFSLLAHGLPATPKRMQLVKFPK